MSEVRLWPACCHDFGRRFTGLSVIRQSKEVQISFFVVQQPNSGSGRLFIEVTWSYTIRRARAVGLVRRNCHLVTEATYAAHYKQKRWTFMPSAGFEPAIPAMEPLPPGWPRKFRLVRTKWHNTRWCRCFGLHTARCVPWITNATDSVWTDSLFTRYEVLKAVLLLMFHVFWDVQEVLECLVLKMKVLRSSLEPLSCNVASNSVISLWRCQMLMTEHLTSVVRTRTNFWISNFNLYWIKSQGEKCCVVLCLALRCDCGTSRPCQSMNLLHLPMDTA